MTVIWDLGFCHPVWAWYSLESSRRVKDLQSLLPVVLLPVLQLALPLLDPVGLREPVNYGGHCCKLGVDC